MREGRAGTAATDDWLGRIEGIRQWSRGGERAPHKPLLLLYSLGRLRQTGTTKVPYAEAEPSLVRLLREFGPGGRASSPAYPFHHLQTDGLWVIETADGSTPGANPGRLKSSAATGALAAGFEAALRAEPRLFALVARFLLDRNFPESLHPDICDAVGVDLETVEVDAARARAAGLRRRNTEFRNVVLMAYERRCAMCGYDGQVEGEAVGLDAAHLRWWALDGPDTVDNALCLCSLHHKLLDRGVLGVTSEHTVAVSAHFIGRGRTAEELVLRLAGAPLLEPQRGQPVPADEHIAWHGGEVFRAPPRVPA